MINRITERMRSKVDEILDIISEHEHADISICSGAEMLLL